MYKYDTYYIKFIIEKINKKLLIIKISLFLFKFKNVVVGISEFNCNLVYLLSNCKMNFASAYIFINLLIIV